MTKKSLRVLLIFALLTVFIFAGLFCFPQYVYAAPSNEAQTISENAENQPVEGAEVDGGQIDEPTTAGVSDSVKQYLVSVYGDEWESYYNQIVEQWGSVEKYLLSASENLPEKYKYKAQELIVNAGGYVPLVAYCILIVGGVVIIIYQHLKNKKLNREISSIKVGQNQELEGDLAVMNGIKAIFTVLKDLAPGEQFDSARAAMDNAEAAINKTSEDIKKDA